MPHPEFTVLLARQRSGTNALLSVLETNPDIFCFDEVFRLDEGPRHDPVQQRANYFTFLTTYAAGDVTRIFPDRHEQVLVDYLAHLRGVADKRLVVVDVKYNSTHHLSGLWQPIGEPALFGMLMAREIAVLHLTRRNYLRCLLSTMKAWQSKEYYMRNREASPDRRITLPPTWALPLMAQWHTEDAIVERAFADYTHYHQVEYADLFPDAGGAMASGPLEQLRQWFGVGPSFTTRAAYSKQSSLPLSETIENIDEVAAAFRGTPFEHCLEDEPAYRT